MNDRVLGLVEEFGEQKSFVLNYSIFKVFLPLPVVHFVKLPPTLWSKDVSTKLFLALSPWYLNSNP